MIRAASTLAVGGALMAAQASASTQIKVDSAFPLPPFYKVDKPLPLETASTVNEPAGHAPKTPATATVRKDTHKYIYSETLPGNLLPNFLFQAGSIEGGSIGLKTGGGRGTAKPFSPDDSCGDDIFDNAMIDMRSPQLPYLTQDLWTCDRIPDYEEEVVVMENEEIKLTVTPQYAGKVFGIFDKRRGKELLFANRAHQPANIGALKSWASGGAEWNWSPGIIGHSAFSETQVFTAKVDTERGPVVRVYEFDRYNGTVWQVDMLLGGAKEQNVHAELYNDANHMERVFFAHPRITNPTPNDLRGYWWTCVAIDATTSTRVLTPAKNVAQTSRDPMRLSPWPFFNEALENSTFHGYEDKSMTDQSYLGNHQIGDMFLRINKNEVMTPYIASNQDYDEGFTYVHGHPLNGTKFYTWGDSGPGRFMQDFLAGGGKRQGDYTELQVGPAPTQMQDFPVPRESVTEWTEWFKGFYGDEKKIRSDNHDEAINEIDEWMKSSVGMPKEVVNDYDAFLSKHSTVEPTEILFEGQPWGALEERLLGHRLAPGLVFTLPKDNSTLAYKEVKPWLELVDDGAFSEETLSKLPLSYQTTDRWLNVLEKSATHQGMTWLHALHLGIAYAERGSIDKPRELFTKSNALKPNPIATRCLGLLESEPEAVWPYLQEAWKVLHTNFYHDKDAYKRLTLNMINEISMFLLQHEWYPQMEEFVHDVLEHNYMDTYLVDSFLTMQIRVLMNKKDFNTAKDILSSHCFPTFAKARDTLMSMWNECTEGLAELNKGSPLSILEKHQARKASRIPDNIGCQYASEYCDNYW